MSIGPEFPYKSILNGECIDKYGAVGRKDKRVVVLLKVFQNYFTIRIIYIMLSFSSSSSCRINSISEVI